MLNQKNNKTGFTLAELLVVITIFSIVMMTATALYSRYTSADRRLKLENELYEETRFTLERIVKEFREGTVDYEEYWNQRNTGLCGNGEIYGRYGNCYGFYANQFYTGTLNNGQFVTDAVSAYQQSELYIIDSTGTKRTYLKCDSCDNNPNPSGRLKILELNGYDIGYKTHTISAPRYSALFNDGKIDTWVCAKDYKCNGNPSNGTETAPKLNGNNDGWENYSPPTINITDLKFYIAPLKDPRKAFNESTESVQMQPHITIILTAELSDAKYKGVPGKKPSLTLQTTVSARVFNEVK